MKLSIKLVLFSLLMLVTSLIFITYYDKKITLAPGVTVEGYLKTASDRIMTMLESHGVNEMPPRSDIGIEIIDRCLTSNTPFRNDEGLKSRNAFEVDSDPSIPTLWFPSGFFSTGHIVKSGFVKSDPRRYSFEYVALWKSRENQRWKKSSIIFTRDRDVIKREDEYVDDAWIVENLQEFPASNTKTRSMIDNLNHKQKNTTVQRE